MKSYSPGFRLLIACTLLALLDPLMVSGQCQTGGVPLSFSRALNPLNVITADIPEPSANRIREDETASSLPYRFALSLPVDISTANSGTTQILRDNQLIWRLSIHSTGAKALILYFDRFSIPQTGKLFVYNPSRTRMFGAYTSANTNSFGAFACPLIEGENLVLEYNAPSSLALPDIHISDVGYAYRGIAGYDENNLAPSSGICEVNVNCTEGDNWQKQKRGVVKLLIKDSLGALSYCSGSVINNARNDGTPYILTANHCGHKSRPVDLSQWLFYFNYEMPGCLNTTPLAPRTMLGAVMKAHGGTEFTGSDFYLVRLNDTIPDSLHVFFNGWSRQDVSSPNGTGIHHPGGDVKKISTYISPLLTANYPGNPYPCFWQVYWTYTAHGHGVTEKGSSGSPIFNSGGLIVGTLTGGDSDCDTNWINSSDYYGKFSWHWDKNGTDSLHILNCWLDPDNTGVTTLAGLSLGITKQEVQSDVKLFPNPVHERAFLILEDEGLIRKGVSISLTGILGNPVPASVVSKLSPGNYSIDLRSLPSGVYVIVISGQNYHRSLKLLKM